MTQNKKPNFGLAGEKLKEFAQHLVKEKDFQGLDQATSEMLVEDVYDRLEERVNAVILASLPAEKLQEFDALLNSGNREQVSDFCEKNIPNLQEVIAQALVAFEKTYLGV